jgi:hypothetical protein
MNQSRDPDQQFHENLRSMGRQIDVPGGPTPEIQSRCLAAFDSPRRLPHWRMLQTMKKPFVISGLGLAASIALVVMFLSPWNGGPTAQAAMIMQKLSEQVEQSTLLDVKIDALHIDEVYVNGSLQVAQQAVAGDIQVNVNENDGESVDLDIALAMSEDGGWILIRELSLSDPGGQAIVSLLFPKGTETLLVLPKDHEQHEVPHEINVEIGQFIDGVYSDNIIQTLRDMIDSHEDYGATIEEQEDGTILLTLPIEDAEALVALERTFSQETDDADAVEIDLQTDEDNDLIGSTLTVVYDPAAEVVRSFGGYDLGSEGGNITVTIGAGEIDPALLDSSRVTTPNTRTLDLSALESMLISIE